MIDDEHLDERKDLKSRRLDLILADSLSTHRSPVDDDGRVLTTLALPIMESVGLAFKEAANGSGSKAIEFLVGYGRKGRVWSSIVRIDDEDAVRRIRPYVMVDVDGEWSSKPIIDLIGCFGFNKPFSVKSQGHMFLLSPFARVRL